jgi:hypothetical protein
MLVETANCCGINEERDHGNYRSLILIWYSTRRGDVLLRALKE